MKLNKHNITQKVKTSRHSNLNKYMKKMEYKLICKSLGKFKILGIQGHLF